MQNQNLTSHRQKKYNNQILLYAILLILLVIFFSTIGLNLLINMSSFIVNMNNGETTQQNENTDSTYLLPPTIYDIPDATNSATIRITGQAQSGNILTLFVNDKKEHQVTIRDNEFETEVDLEKGENEVYFTLQTKDKKTTKESQHYTVSYLSEKPRLEVESPKDGEKTNKNEVTIKGVTNRGVTLTVNDAPGVVDSEGGFSHTLRLQEGENTIKLVATDIAGNSETLELKVTYQKDE